MRCQFWADYTTNMFEFEFPTRTPVGAAAYGSQRTLGSQDAERDLWNFAPLIGAYFLSAA
jgi:hypothetical protein